MGQASTRPLHPADQSIIQSGRDLFIMGGEFNDNRTYHITPQSSDPLDMLEQHCAPNAIHTSASVGSQEMCMPGTRTFTLSRLQSLVSSNDQDSPDVIWMHGPAGAGKSAIMRTIANTVDDEGALLASFFFFRADGTRNSSTVLIPTIASQAISAVSAAEAHILALIRKKQNVFSQSVRNQTRLLLGKPLLDATQADPAEWRTGTPLVVVVDGLDECSDPDRQVEIINSLVQLAATIKSRTNRRLKILIASRPEEAIKVEFEALDGAVTVVKLDPSDANIDLFYDTRLDKMRRRHGLPKTWPSRSQIAWLREKTSGQYSFAHVSMGFLDEGDPVARLEMLETNLPTHGLRPFDPLDALYTTVFRRTPPEMLQSALMIVNLRHRLDSSRKRRITNGDVEDLLQLPVGYTARLSPYLSSVISFDNPSGFAVYHASLHDFLTDPGRSSKYGLFIDDVTLANAFVSGLVSLWARFNPTTDENISNWWIDARKVAMPLILKIHKLDITDALENLIRSMDNLPLIPLTKLSIALSPLQTAIKHHPDALEPSSVDAVNKALLQVRHCLHRCGVPESIEGLSQLFGEARRDVA